MTHDAQSLQHLRVVLGGVAADLALVHDALAHAIGAEDVTALPGVLDSIARIGLLADTAAEALGHTRVMTSTEWLHSPAVASAIQALRRKVD